jgi:hypothetical protein
MRVLPLLFLAATACYLPGGDSTLPVESQVQVAVYRCAAERVGGDILNNADVPVVISIKAKWLDTASATYHEVDAGPFPAAAKSSVPWEVEAEEQVADPAQCQAEIVSVTEEQP